MGITNDYSDKKIERDDILANKDDISVTGERVDALLEICSRWFESYSVDIEKEIEKLPIHPTTIDCFLQRMNIFEPLENYFTIGQFATYLVQHSFNQGHNNFNLNFTSYECRHPLYLFGNKLEGTSDNYLTLSLRGYVGTYAFKSASHVHTNVYSAAHFGFGEAAEHSIFYLHGGGDSVDLAKVGNHSAYCEWHVSCEEFLERRVSWRDTNEYFLLKSDGSSEKYG